MQSPELSENERLCCPTCRAIYRSGFKRCPADGAELTACETDPMVGTTLVEHYVIEENIGEGAMGRVYRARHARLERRQFAVKILLGDLATDTAMRQRFAREAEAASRLEHPNVVSVIDFGESPEGLLYIVMELVRGNTLADLIDSVGPLGEQRVLALSRGLCLGLAHAHEQGLVHRDFKPDNVALFDSEEGPVPRILDFGLAIVSDPGEDATRLTQAGLVMGTPAYTAPEQARGGDIDHRVDLFALGTTMYEMLAGRIPYDGSVMEVLHANIGAEPPAIAERTPGVSVAPELERIVRKLLEKRPADRFQSAREVLDALDALDLDGAGENTSIAAAVPVAAGSGSDRPGRTGRGVDAHSDTMLATPVPEKDDAHSDTVAATAADHSEGAEAEDVSAAEVTPDADVAAPDDGPIAHEERGRAWPVAALLGASAALVVGFLLMRGSDDSAQPRSPSPERAAAQHQPAPERSTRAELEAGPISTEPREDSPEATPEPPPPALAAKESPADRPAPSRRRKQQVRRAPDPPATATPATDEPAGPAAKEPSVTGAPPPSLPLKTEIVPPPAPTPEREPPAKPAGPLDATAAVTGFKSSGSLSRSVARRAIDRAESKFRGCYKTAAKKAGKNAAAKISVQLTLAETGRARDVKVGTAPLPGLSACVKAAVSDVRSRVAPDVGTVRVSFAVRFSPVKP